VRLPLNLFPAGRGAEDRCGFTRRDFLRGLSASLCVSGGRLLLGPLPFLRELDARIDGPEETKQSLFEEISAAKSGIAWQHVNGPSPEYYLPETTGAGCAALDYDNDGWMDIYLVNSGKCDFFTPEQPLRNALYRNNRFSERLGVKFPGPTRRSAGNRCPYADQTRLRGPILLSLLQTLDQRSGRPLNCG
jgi:hypothetical protein